MLTAEIIIERPVKVVWAYFTKPQHWEKWWGGGLRRAEWKPGGKLEWALGGASLIEDVIPARMARIRGAWMTTTWTFESAGDQQTRVRIQEGEPRGGASFSDGGAAHLRQLNEALSKLKACIEGEEPVPAEDASMPETKTADIQPGDTSQSGRSALPVRKDRSTRQTILIVLGVVACLCLTLVILVGGGFWITQKAEQAAAATQAEMTAAAQAQGTATAQVQATGTAIAQATAMAKPTPTATSEQILILKDTFSHNINRWDVGDVEEKWWKGNAQIVDGKFRVTVQRSAGFFWIWWPAPEVGSFNISLDAQLVKGSASDACYGLIFRSQEDSLYFFKVCENGRYTVLMWADDTWYTLIDWTITRAIQHGQPNTLMVEGRGSHFEFYINGVLVNELENSRLKNGHVGIAVEVEEGETPIFEFDNYILYSFIGQ